MRTHENAETAIKDATVGTKEAVAELKTNLQEVGEQAYDTAKKVISDVKDTGEDVIKGAAHEGQRQIESMENCIRRHPLRSVLVAAAAGILLSKLTK